MIVAEECARRTRDENVTRSRAAKDLGLRVQ